MINYLEYFNILKYKTGDLISTGDLEKDEKLQHAQKIFTNEGLSTEWTPEKLVIEGALLKGPTEGFINGIRAIRNLIKTNKFVKFVGKLPKSNSGLEISKLSETEQEFVKYLQDQGIDISKFSNDDIRIAINNRKAAIHNSVPAQKYAVVTEEPMNNSLTRGLNTRIETYSKNYAKPIGYLRLETAPEEYSVGMIQKLGQENGISQQAYNASIEYAKQQSQPGIVSGKLLFMPEVTTKVWKHYPTKQLLGNYGHQIGVGGKTPVYLLTEPSYKVPIKNGVKFDLKTLDKNGNMMIDWSNPDMFYAEGGKI